jgi:hypothetical protein
MQCSACEQTQFMARLPRNMSRHKYLTCLSNHNNSFLLYYVVVVKAWTTVLITVTQDSCTLRSRVQWTCGCFPVLTHHPPQCALPSTFEFLHYTSICAQYSPLTRAPPRWLQGDRSSWCLYERAIYFKCTMSQQGTFLSDNLFIFYCWQHYRHIIFL